MKIKMENFTHVEIPQEKNTTHEKIPALLLSEKNCSQFKFQPV